MDDNGKVSLPVPIGSNTPENSDVPAITSLPAAVLQTALNLHQAVLSGRNAQTVRAYASDYDDFARFMELGSGAAALDALVGLSKRLGVSSVIAYRAHMVDRKLAATTVNRRLSALRAAVKLARQLGRVDWDLEVEGLKAEAYRDTRGPGSDGWGKLLAKAREQATMPKGRRDLAILCLLHDTALRRNEVVSIDVQDVDLAGSVVMVKGKGKSAKSPITIPSRTRGSLADWLAVRGLEPGPLFRSLHNQSGERLSSTGLYKLIRKLGKDAGLSRPLRPHGLRHQGITTALDRTKGNIRAVQQYSRHANPKTVMIYDDKREDLAGKVAELVSQD